MKQGQAKKLMAAGAAMTIAEPALALAHTGGTGVIVGLAVGAIAYLVADEISEAKGSQGDVPATPALDKKQVERVGKSSLAYRLINGKSVRGEDEQPANVPTGLPRRSPTFAEMRHLIPERVDVLGFDGRLFICADPFSQSVNMAAIGLPRSGKTVCLTFHVAQAVMRGAEIRGWDIHGDVAKSLGSLFHILDDVDEIVDDSKNVRAELDRRRALRKRANNHDQAAKAEWDETRELFLIIDEFMALVTRLKLQKQDRQELVSTILLLIAEGAKYKVRLMLAGQTMPAALFGDDGSSARDIIATKYAFQSRDDQARMFGIDAKAIENLLPLLRGQDYKGYAVLAGGPLLEPVLVSIPYTTVEDIRILLEELGYVVGSQASDEEELPEGITEADLEQIVQAYEAGWSPRDIASLVQMDLRTFKEACELVGIDILAAPAPAAPVPATSVPTVSPMTPRPEPVLLPRKPRKAVLEDAKEVWIACGGGIGRPRLQKELRNRGLECSDYLAADLLAQVTEWAKTAVVVVDGVAVGDE